MKILLLIPFLLLAISSYSQSHTITLKTSRIIDGKGGIIEGMNIIITDGKIAEISKKEEGDIYDLTHLTVMPGGIDTHNHFAWHFDPDGKLHDAKPEEESKAQETMYAMENAYITLEAGITTVQSVGSAVDADVRDAVNRGNLPGPRIITSIGAIFQNTGNPDEIRAKVDELADQGAQVIKIFASGSIRTGGTPTLTQEQLNAACGEAKKRGLRSVVHAHGPESVRRAVEAGCTSIEHGVLLDQATLDLIASKGVYFDPQIDLIFRNYFENEDKYIGVNGYTKEGFDQMHMAVEKAVNVFKMALKTKGLKIVFGTDAVAGAHGKNYDELIARVKTGGEDPMDAIISATSRAAESLNMNDQIGTIAPGMLADIIAVRGNPLENIEVMKDVPFVMKGGTIFKSLSEEIK